MNETRVKGARPPQNKKIATNERRPAPKRLCCKTLCPKEARWQRTHISRRLYKLSKVIIGKVCLIERRRPVESNERRGYWKSGNSNQF